MNILKCLLILCLVVASFPTDTYGVPDHLRDICPAGDFEEQVCRENYKTCFGTLLTPRDTLGISPSPCLIKYAEWLLASEKWEETLSRDSVLNVWVEEFSQFSRLADERPPHGADTVYSSTKRHEWLDEELLNMRLLRRWDLDPAYRAEMQLKVVEIRLALILMKDEPFPVEDVVRVRLELLDIMRRYGGSAAVKAQDLLNQLSIDGVNVRNGVLWSRAFALQNRLAGINTDNPVLMVDERPAWKRYMMLCREIWGTEGQRTRALRNEMSYWVIDFNMNYINSFLLRYNRPFDEVRETVDSTRLWCARYNEARNPVDELEKYAELASALMPKAIKYAVEKDSAVIQWTEMIRPIVYDMRTVMDRAPHWQQEEGEQAYASYRMLVELASTILNTCINDKAPWHATWEGLAHECEQHRFKGARPEDKELWRTWVQALGGDWSHRVWIPECMNEQHYR